MIQKHHAPHHTSIAEYNTSQPTLANTMAGPKYNSGGSIEYPGTKVHAINKQTKFKVASRNEACKKTNTFNRRNIINVTLNSCKSALSDHTDNNNNLYG